MRPDCIYIWCKSRNQKGEPLYHMGAGLVCQTSHRVVQGVCLSARTVSVWEEGLLHLMRLLLLLRATMPGISQHHLQWLESFIQNQAPQILLIQLQKLLLSQHLLHLLRKPHENLLLYPALVKVSVFEIFLYWLLFFFCIELVKIFLFYAKVNVEPPKETPSPESNSKENSMGSIVEDSKEDEVEDEEGLTIHPYDRLKTISTDPAPDIDVAKREVFLFSSLNTYLSTFFLNFTPPILQNYPKRVKIR